MRYSDLLESRTAPLYHGTTISSCVGIIATNTLGTHPKDVISLSRSYQFAERFAKERMMGGQSDPNVIVLELDQQKLTHRYKMEPYNDPYSADEDGVYFRSGSFSNQMEESVHGAIRPLSRYLTKIIVNNPQLVLPPEIAKHHLLYDFSTKKFINKNWSRTPSINAR